MNRGLGFGPSGGAGSLDVFFVGLATAGVSLALTPFTPGWPIAKRAAVALPLVLAAFWARGQAASAAYGSGSIPHNSAGTVSATQQLKLQRPSIAGWR